MMTTRFSLLAAGLAIAVLLRGCRPVPTDFPVAVGNRTASHGHGLRERCKTRRGRIESDRDLHGQAFSDWKYLSRRHRQPDLSGLYRSSHVLRCDIATGILSAGAATTLIHDVTAYVDVARASCSAGGPGLIWSCCQHEFGQFQFTVTACNISISPSSQSFDPRAGPERVSAGLERLLVDRDEQRHLDHRGRGSSGTGNRTVVYQVQANSTGLSRTALLSIAGQAFTVNQAR